MSAQDPPFRFLDLPPELRNIIYTNVLTSTYRVELPRQYKPHLHRALGRNRSL